MPGRLTPITIPTMPARIETERMLSLREVAQRLSVGRVISAKRVRAYMDHGVKLRGVDQRVKLAFQQLPFGRGVWASDLDRFLMDLGAGKPARRAGLLHGGSRANQYHRDAWAPAAVPRMFKRASDGPTDVAGRRQGGSKTTPAAVAAPNRTDAKPTDVGARGVRRRRIS